MSAIYVKDYMISRAIQYTFFIHAHMHMSTYQLRLNTVLDFAIIHTKTYAYIEILFSTKILPKCYLDLKR